MLARDPLERPAGAFDRPAFARLRRPHFHRRPDEHGPVLHDVAADQRFQVRARQVLRLLFTALFEKGIENGDDDRRVAPEPVGRVRVADEALGGVRTGQPARRLLQRTFGRPLRHLLHRHVIAVVIQKHGCADQLAARGQRAFLADVRHFQHFFLEEGDAPDRDRQGRQNGEKRCGPSSSAFFFSLHVCLLRSAADAGAAGAGLSARLPAALFMLYLRLCGTYSSQFICFTNR